MPEIRLYLLKAACSLEGRSGITMYLASALPENEGMS
jgi:hypothetical protein